MAKRRRYQNEESNSQQDYYIKKFNPKSETQRLFYEDIMSSTVAFCTRTRWYW